MKRIVRIRVLNPGGLALADGPHNTLIPPPDLPIGYEVDAEEESGMFSFRFGEPVFLALARDVEVLEEVERIEAQDVEKQ